MSRDHPAGCLLVFLTVATVKIQAIISRDGLESSHHVFLSVESIIGLGEAFNLSHYIAQHHQQSIDFLHYLK